MVTQLSKVILQARLDGCNPHKSKLTFGVEASLQLKKAMLEVRGSFSKGKSDLPPATGGESEVAE